jgi:DNA (cytosine-5)-methyltransferase 1
MKPKYNVIDLFCGCGGASLGVRLAGHRVVAAVDIDPAACKTYSRNLGLTPMCRNLRFLDGHKILEFYGLNKDDVDLMIGCPPCQGFSSLRRTRYPKGDDPRKGLISVFIKRINEIQPRAVIFENVPGISRKIGIRYLKKFSSKMEKMGYKVISERVNAADYGVPQFRKRAITLCTKGKVKPSVPQKTHGNPQKLENSSKPWKTVRDAIGNLPPLRPGESYPNIANHCAHNHSPKVLKIISKIPENGGSRGSLPTDLWLPCHLRLSEKKGGGAESVYGRMSWDMPSPTITCRCTTPSSGRFIHPEQDRAITPREAARLQSFPDDFVFPEGFSAPERLIGNAVPPLLISTLLEGFEE